MKYKEHDIVVTLCEIKSEEDIIPKGSFGTIVHIYDRHRGYEVEFGKEKTVVSVKPFGQIMLGSLEEGYLLTWGEGGDEVHADLITKEHYDRIAEAMHEKTDPEWKAQANASEEAFKIDPLHTWWTQTYCEIPWPYNEIKILGTISVART